MIYNAIAHILCNSQKKQKKYMCSGKTHVVLILSAPLTAVYQLFHTENLSKIE